MKIKYGQIGIQHAHASKIKVYRESPDYEVVGVVESDVAARERAQRDPAYKDLTWMTEEQLLNMPSLQIVGVETEVKHSLATSQRCLDAGKHVHLDKPAGESLQQYKAVLDTAASKHLAVQMGYMYRYNPAVIMMRDWLRRGWLGDPFEIHTVMSKLVSAADRQSYAESPGGTMFELGCHLIDLVIGMLGPPQTVHPFPRHSADVDDRVMDNMLAVLEYPRATATIRSSILEPDGFARRHFALCGTGGSFHFQPLDQPTATIALTEARAGHGKSTHQHRFPKFNRYVADAADLARIIRDEKDADFSYDHDYEVQKTVLQASGLSETPLGR